MDGPDETEVKCRQNRVHSVWIKKAIGKIGKEHLMAGSDVIQVSSEVRYVGRYLDQSLTFKVAVGNLM